MKQLVGCKRRKRETLISKKSIRQKERWREAARRKPENRVKSDRGNKASVRHNYGDE